MQAQWSVITLAMCRTSRRTELLPVSGPATVAATDAHIPRDSARRCGLQYLLSRRTGQTGSPGSGRV